MLKPSQYPEVIDMLRNAIGAERERCAKIADAISEAYFQRALERFGEKGNGLNRGKSNVAYEVATAIRNQNPVTYEQINPPSSEKGETDVTS